MTSTSYLDDYKNSLENIPNMLIQNFTLIQELDSRCQQLMNKIDKVADNHMSNAKEYSMNKNNETMESIQHQFDTPKKFSDDKFKLSLQNYEMLDEHIRKLDLVLAKFKAEIQFKAEFSDEFINATSHLPLKKRGSKMTSAASSVSAVTDGITPINSVANVAINTSFLNTGALVGAAVAHLAEVDMPIDPNKPTFCLCNQV